MHHLGWWLNSAKNQAENFPTLQQACDSMDLSVTWQCGTDGSYVNADMVSFQKPSVVVQWKVLVHFSVAYGVKNECPFNIQTGLL